MSEIKVTLRPGLLLSVRKNIPNDPGQMSWHVAHKGDGVLFGAAKLSTVSVCLVGVFSLTCGQTAFDLPNRRVAKKLADFFGVPLQEAGEVHV